MTEPASQPVDDATGLPQYVTAAKFRKLLALSDRAFRRGLAAGRIPAPDLRWGRSLRWRVETVRAFFEKLEAERGSKKPRNRESA